MNALHPHPEAVDFIVIAGDLYDGNWKDYNTGHFFVREMGRLNAAGIPIYLLYGDHDAESEMTRRLSFPPNVHLFDTRKASTHRIGSFRWRCTAAASRTPPRSTTWPSATPRRCRDGSTSACCAPRCGC